MNEAVDPLLRWIPLLPVLVAAYHAVMVGIVRRATLGRLAGVLSTGALAASLVLTIVAYFRMIRLPADSTALTDSVTTWIGTGVGASRFTAEVAFRLDPLAAVLALFIGGFALAIHLHGASTLWGDRGASRFFASLGFFTFSALVFVLADNLLLLFLGLQGASLGQALLSGYRYEEHTPSRNAVATAVVQRFGDLGFILGLFFGFTALVQRGLGTLDVTQFSEHLAAHSDALGTIGVGSWAWPRSEVIALCFLIAAFARTAQGPLLLFWERALEGRVESLALVQASLGSLLGFALILRLEPLWAVTDRVADVAIWIGAATMLVSAILAATQQRLTRALAFLLASQFGLTWVAIGCHAPVSALFHAMSMAFIFGLLFLCAGRVIEAQGDDPDLNRMGGLRMRLWQEHLLFGIGAFALAGAPLLTGFFSRNEILVVASANDMAGSVALMRTLVLATFVTACVALTLHLRIFWGDSRSLTPTVVLPELSPWKSTPLWSLAILVVFGGILGIPQAYGDLAILGVEDSHSLRNLLRPQFPSSWSVERPPSVVYGVAGVSTAVFIVAFAVARRFALLHSVLGERALDQLRRIAAALSEADRFQRWTDSVWSRPLQRLSERVVDQTLERRFFDHTLGRRLPALLETIAREGVGRANPGRIPFGLVVLILGTGAMLFWVVQ